MGEPLLSIFELLAVDQCERRMSWRTTNRKGKSMLCWAMHMYQLTQKLLSAQVNVAGLVSGHAAGWVAPYPSLQGHRTVGRTISKLSAPNMFPLLSLYR